MKSLSVCPKTLCPSIPNYTVDLIENQFTVGSLISSGLTDAKSFYWDQHKSPENELIDVCNSERPDVVIFGAQPFHYGLFDAVKVLKAIDELKIPTVHLWWDHISPDNQAVAEIIGKHVTLNVVMDLLELPDHTPSNFTTMFYPVDGSLYQQRNRDIDVSFMGTVVPELEDRVACLSYLKSVNREIFLGFGAYSPDAMSLHRYAETLCRSKISLNFSYLPKYERYQCKSRTFEVLRSGALLLEADNPLTRERFTPFEHYVPFSTEIELEHKIKFYLNHPDLMAKIAQAGQKRILECFNERIFWQEIFKKLGFSSENRQ